MSAPVGRCFGLFFFFQAEDGIRDTSVTGVQTCALPIFPAPPKGLPLAALEPLRARIGCLASHGGLTGVPGRSEERRVGKECRSRWSPWHERKNDAHEGRRRHVVSSTVSVSAATAAIHGL